MLVTESKVISVKNSGLKPQEAEFEAAQSSLAAGTVMSAGIYPSLTSRFDFGRCRLRRVRAPSSESHSTPTTVLRRLIRWSISSGVSWRWRWTGSISRTAAMPGPRVERDGGGGGGG
jgi:hypothetical protein